jgi:hypothetical protein
MKNLNKYLIGIGGGIAALAIGSGVSLMLLRKRRQEKKGH